MPGALLFSEIDSQVLEGRTDRVRDRLLTPKKKGVQEKDRRIKSGNGIANYATKFSPELQRTVYVTFLNRT